MARLLGYVRSTVIVVSLVLLLDFVVSLFIPASTVSNLAAARDRESGLYDLTVRYHHDLRPNLARHRIWGADAYPFVTDAYGFRTGACAGTDPAAERERTVFVIGDSFTEGLGVPFERTFAGLLACAYRAQGQVVRNLGVAGYSPVIYHRKLRAAADRLALKPRHVLLFLDISDIHNDAIDYVEQDGRIYAGKPTVQRQVVDFLKRNFMSVAIVLQLRQRLLGDRGGSIARVGNELSRWTVRDDDMRRWARRGLDVTAANLDKSVALCRQWGCELTLVVYPWPDQIVAGDRDSIQVSYWRHWAAERGVGFINAFEPFFREPTDDVLRKYYIDGDVHWTAAGHSLIFDEVRPVLLAQP
jgi:lysophospholipase L1-like esterase